MTNYIWIRENGKNRNEHRKIMEIKLGRKLKSNEIVHHKNGNGEDNSLKNLQLMTPSEHNKIHHKKAERIKLKCEKCNKIFYHTKKKYIWNLKNGQKRFFCSRKCSDKITLFNKNQKKAKKLILKCEKCNKKFERNKSKHLYNVKMGRIHVFCSKKCSIKSVLNQYHTPIV